MINLRGGAFDKALHHSQVQVYHFGPVAASSLLLRADTSRLVSSGGCFDVKSCNCVDVLSAGWLHCGCECSGQPPARSSAAAERHAHSPGRLAWRKPVPHAARCVRVWVRTRALRCMGLWEPASTCPRTYTERLPAHTQRFIGRVQAATRTRTCL